MTRVNNIGVWLSLARAPGLGREVASVRSCHPDNLAGEFKVEHQPSKLDTWVRFPSPAFRVSTDIWKSDSSEELILKSL